MSTSIQIVTNENDIGQAVLGGLLIGIATTLNLLLYGKVSGANSILFGSIFPQAKQEYTWKFPFLMGLVSLPYALFIEYGNEIMFKNTPIGNYNLVMFDDVKTTVLDLHIIGFLMAGFAIGFGARISNGCLSGHVICGVPRFSLRSWISFLFMISSAIAVATFRSLYPFLDNGAYVEQEVWRFFGLVLWLMTIGLLFVTLIGLTTSHFCRALFQITCGAFLSLGLLISGLCRKTKVLGFLTVSDEWDPQIGIALGTAILFNMITFSIIIKCKKSPAFSHNFEFNRKKNVDLSLILGSILYGAGLGLAGFASAPAFIDFFNNTHLVPFVAMLILGQWVGFQIQDKDLNASMEEKEPLTGS